MAMQALMYDDNYYRIILSINGHILEHATTIGIISSLGNFTTEQIYHIKSLKCMVDCHPSLDTFLFKICETLLLKFRMVTHRSFLIFDQMLKGNSEYY